MGMTNGVEGFSSLTTGERVHVTGKRQEFENVSDDEESAVVRSTANWLAMESKDFDIVEETLHHILTSQNIGKTKMKNIEPEQNIKKGVFNFMVDWKKLVQKTSVDTKLSQLEKSLRINQEEPAREEVSRVLIETTESFGLSLTGKKIVVPEEVKK